ncbi:hypothetical protein F5Y19DRAFT_423609 [Xylariaceae sp. FL1651]|nr:hypothetical protein F5Y19DRAFT_423609 [Xylariaceae sp. FL1651]
MAAPCSCRHLRNSDALEDRGRDKSLKGCRICRAAGFRYKALLYRWNQGSTFYNQYLSKAIAESRERGAGFNPNETLEARDLFDRIPQDDKKQIAITPLTPAFDTQIKPYQASIPKDDESPVKWRVLFRIEKGQNGECYHAIIAALTTNSFITSAEGDKLYKELKASVFPFTLSVQYTGSGGNNATTTQQKLLLETFLQQYQYKESYDKWLVPYSKKKDYHHRRPQATEEFVKFFKANPNPKDQEGIHQRIAELFNYEPLASVLKSQTRRKDDPLLPDHVTPSFLASYYLDCLLTQTRQSLPERGDGCRVVVLFVRRNNTSPDDRRMDPKNVHGVVKALSDIRNIKDNAIHPISHVILYGDIPESEGTGLRDTFAGQISVVWIGTPFQGEAKNGAAHPVWESFKSNNLDYMPVEIKVMGLLLALKQRHRDRLACLGFRSGSLDGAAFLGIPTFSLDNTLVKRRAERLQKDRDDGKPSTSKSPYVESRDYFEDNISPGAYLWDLRQYGCHIAQPGEERFERMEHVSRWMNSFIEIHLIYYLDPSNTGGKGRKPERLTEANGLSHLRAAVAVYLCRDDGSDGRPLWTRRLDLMGTSTANIQDYFAQVLTFEKRR